MRRPSGTRNCRSPGLAGDLEGAIGRAGRRAILGSSARTAIGVFELEADATIPAEYCPAEGISSGEAGGSRAERRATNYLGASRVANGGWPACSMRGVFKSVPAGKPYFALKMSAFTEAPILVRARDSILAPWRGRDCNVPGFFTRATARSSSAQIPGRGVAG